MFGFVTVRLRLERAPAEYRRLINPAFPAMPLRQQYRVVDWDEFTHRALIFAQPLTTSPDTTLPV